MIGPVQTITDCSRFIAASDPIGAGVYLRRLGMAWLAAAALCSPAYIWGTYTDREVIAFCLLLLLLVAGSGIARFPFRHGTREIVAVFWIMIGACTSETVHSAEFLEAEALIPAWQAHLCALLAYMAWMLAFFTWLTAMLCQRHLTGKNDLRDVAGTMKEMRLTRTSDTLLIIAGCILLFCSWYSEGLVLWGISMILAALVVLTAYRMLSRYRNYLQSIGKIA